MTENEWLTCSDPTIMLEFLQESGQGNNEQFRLFAVECCYRVWNLIKDNRSHDAVSLAEKYAHGHANDSELFAPAIAANEAGHPSRGNLFASDLSARTAAHLTNYAPNTLVTFTQSPGRFAPEAFAKPESFASMSCIFVGFAGLEAARESNGAIDADEFLESEYAEQANLLRDHFPNSFGFVGVKGLSSN